jgi:predicted nuclease with TOPRIM domain
VMAQTDALQQALARFGTSLDTLERFLGQLFEDRESAIKFKEQVRSLTDERNRLASERDRLAAELDHERSRARRLEDANSEVSGRLEVVMGTLRNMMPAKGAEY